MRLFKYLGGFLALAIFALPLSAQEAKKNPIGDILGGKAKKGDTKDQKPKIKRITWGTVFGGELTKQDKGTLNVKVTQNVKVPYADAAKRLYNYQVSVARRQRDLGNRIAAIQRAKSAQQRATAIRNYQNLLRQRPPTPPKLYQMKKISKDIPVRPAAKMLVRVSTPDPQYDGKGNIVPLTKDKLRQLQGPEGYPGFPAELSDLGKGSYVQVYLAKPKRTKNGKKKPPSIKDILGGNKTSDDGKDALVDLSLPEAVMIVVVRKQ